MKKILLGILLSIMLLVGFIPQTEVKAADPVVPISLQPSDNSTKQIMLAQGVDPKNAMLVKDYGVNGANAYTQIYKDVSYKGAFEKYVAVIGQLPKVDNNGVAILPQWVAGDKGVFFHGNNTFQARVDNQLVTITAKNAQLDGVKQGEALSFLPQILLDGKLQSPISTIATLLTVDPTNSSYQNNVLVWDYGFVQRQFRLIEGSIIGSWIFKDNPKGTIRIYYNQNGAFRLKLGQYADGNDSELISTTVFDKATYPLTIGDSLTFYPDATAVDGYAYIGSAETTWATLRNSAGSVADDAATTLWATYFGAGATTNKWINIGRGIVLFNTASIPDTAAISAATLSLYGSIKSDSLSAAPNINIYSSNPALSTALTGTDYSTLGITAYCDTPWTYAGFSTSGYNDFVFNATGIAAISLTGISKFGIRNASYDVANSAPPWIASQTSMIFCYATEKGVGYQPMLVVTYLVVVAPTITATAASNIGATTARLNSNLNDDGNAACAVRFGYGQTSQTSGNFTLYTTNTTWTGYTYVTNDTPYIDVTSLSSNTTYYYRVQAKNSSGNSTSANEISFTTAVYVGDITSFFGTPAATSITLSWTFGIGDSQALVRYRTDAYPTSKTDGTQVCLTSDSSFDFTGLTSGRTYYFMIWGESGGSYSSGNSTLALTTRLPPYNASNITAPTIANWLQTQTLTHLTGLGIFYTVGSDFIASWGMPQTTGWMLLWLVFCSAIGLITWILSKQLFVGAFFTAAGIVWGVMLGLYSAWYIVILVFILLGVWALKKAVFET